jgi:transketolase N-terminal domain/subunit
VAHTLAGAVGGLRFAEGTSWNSAQLGVHSYAFDAEGNVIKSVGNGSTLSEVYNALGWRVEAIEGGTIIDNVHDAAGLP